MRNCLVIFGFVVVFTACKTKEEPSGVTSTEKEDMAYAVFGDAITTDAAKSIVDLAELYKTLRTGDTITTKIMGVVDEVCQNKGCWMKLKLADDQQVMVKFKDYDFFVPKDIAGQEVVFNGKAFISEVSVGELRHYAEDAGKPAEEIAAITQPEATLSFEADGVLLKSE